MIITKKHLNELTYQIIGAAIEVHKTLGPGLLESIYEKCLLHEFTLRNINWKKQVAAPLSYKGIDLESTLRLDILAENMICIELKAIEGLLPVHDAVLLSYMRLLQKPKGILINFQCVNIFREGQRTFVNDLFAELPEG